MCHKMETCFQIGLYSHGIFSKNYMKGKGTISSENVSHNVHHNISF